VTSVMARPHVPVMAAEVIEHLAVRPGGWYADCTFGAGGHTRLLLEAGANVLAIDQDPEAATHLAADEVLSKAQHAGRLRLAGGNFRELERLAHGYGVTSLAGALLDLGVSSMQLGEEDRGFAFRHDGPLDMRMSNVGESAADVVNDYPVEELAAIIWRYGEERHSRRIARRIGEERLESPIVTTGRLAAVIASAYPPGHRREHPARRTFQALRIHVNDELGALQEGLEAASRLLETGGRIVVISYHSLEDRIVKRFLKDSPRFAVLLKKPLTPSEAEIETNPRARSAKLRAGAKVAA